jgi:hypothetical protein
MSVSSGPRFLSDEDVYRTLIGASTSSLLQLCRRGDWHRVRQRIQCHPHEVVDDCLWYAIRSTGYHPSSFSSARSPPLSVALVLSLLQINPRQLQILHPLTGTILHEAIQYWCPNTIIDFLLHAVIEYNNHQCTFASKNLLDVQDDIGRTLLHCMVGRWQRFHVAPQIMSSATSSSALSDMQLFSRLHQAHPRQARVRDIDGYTPLLLLLQTPPPQDIPAQEAEIHQMAQCMLLADPTLVHLARETRYDQLTSHASTGSRGSTATPRSHIHTPLFYALLYGRSYPTIQLLLDAYRASSTDRKSSFASVRLSQYQEVALHLAITTHADGAICDLLMHEDPSAVLQPDRDGLTPLDWQWLSFLRDADPHTTTTRHLVSRRRQWPGPLPEWHAQWDAQDVVLPLGALRDSMLDRFQRMLRAAAPEYYAQQQRSPLRNMPLEAECASEEKKPWHVLHAACLVPCPTTVIRWILTRYYDGEFPRCAEARRDDGESKVCPPDKSDDPLRWRDVRRGRYPLHYAVSRVSYQKALPPRSFLATSAAGQSSLPRLQDQWSPVYVILPLYPAACRCTDGAGQLPLHIAIDTYKQHRSGRDHTPSLDGRRCNGAEKVNDGDQQLFYEREEDSVLQLLLQNYPGALQQKDGRSKLYPWQQASIGDGARLSTIYQLFRSNPTLW